MQRIKLKDPTAFQEMLIKAGYSRRALGRAVGISEPYANQIVTGRRTPSPGVAKKICDVLGVSFDDIFLIEHACNSEHCPRAANQ
ncbi:helix-turn-helix domain-containing protein [Desulfovirgula thermocuniculi]|uniref:helix-turn-helix domain-containing protein n=1 Tax=Desulfovirgula thermocuniculi TaxID=348842 RepID=UPI000A0731E3|nr:helix-turn-helix transcriptional regulator [Desulfovirgula thermocuniculi]